MASDVTVTVTVTITSCDLVVCECGLPYVVARFAILDNVDGCPSPSTLFLVCMT